MSARSNRREPSQGYVLVAVLAVMLLLSGLMAGGSMFVRSALHSASIEDDDVAMSGLARAGLEMVAFQLFNQRQSIETVDGRRIRFGAATLVPTVIDEAGKIDLNGASPDLLQSLFATIMDDGMATALVARIQAIRGDPLPAGGSPTATQPQTGGGPAPQAPSQKKHTGFQSIDQLRDLVALSPTDWQALRRKLTIFNPDGKIDILTADADVLSTLPGVTKAVAQDIVARRLDADAPTLGRLQAELGLSIALTKSKPGPAYSVRILATSAARRSRSTEAVIAESKSPNEPFYVLDWQE